MDKDKIRFLIVLISTAILIISPLANAKTWHLGQDQDLKDVQTDDNSQYLLEVAQIKQLVNRGQTEAVRLKLERLKKDFPQIAGPDLEAFLEAEMLFCDGKWSRNNYYATL